MSTATATACSNIALVKYWGKRSAVLNLPAAGSLSLSLDALTTTTTVAFSSALSDDVFELNGQRVLGAPQHRTRAFLDLVRQMAGVGQFASVRSRNSFPTASGLASSASGFAALALAASRAAGLTLTPTALSVLARRGSGSAARSVFGGLVRMLPGHLADGSDAYAEPIADEAGLGPRLRMVVAVVGGGVAKAWGSRDAMEHCAATSPLHAAWIDLVPRDLALAERAIFEGDLTALGTVAEANALAMHANAMASRPAIVYWQPATLAVMAAVRELRAAGTMAWSTMDAGPHVKVLTHAEHAPPVVDALRGVPGVSSVIVAGPGGAAHVVAAVA